MVIGTRAKFLRNSCIASISILGFFMVVFGLFLGVLATRATAPDTTLTVIAALFVIEAVFGGILAWQIVLLVAILRCPEELILREGDNFRLHVKGTGYVTLPCASVMMVKPVNAFMTAGWIGLASGRYDATLEVTTTDNRNYRVPYVRLAPSVADAMMRIAYEVRSKAQSAASGPANPPAAPNETGDETN